MPFQYKPGGEERVVFANIERKSAPGKRIASSKTLGRGTCLHVQGIVKSEERTDGVSIGNSFKPLIKTSAFILSKMTSHWNRRVTRSDFVLFCFQICYLFILKIGRWAERERESCGMFEK